MCCKYLNTEPFITKHSQFAIFGNFLFNANKNRAKHIAIRIFPLNKESK